MARKQPSVEILPLDQLHRHPRNYRDHPEDQLAHIQRSLVEHGQYRPIVVAEDDTILAGHGVVEAARRLDWAELEVRRLPIKSDSPAALRLLAGDNEISRRAWDDDRALAELLHDLQGEDPDFDGLLGTGYDSMMLANLVYVTRPADEVDDFDAAAEWAGMPKYEDGEQRYRLVIGFESEEERARFLSQAEIGLRIKSPGSRTWSGVWPPREIDDLASVRYNQVT